MRPPAGFVRLRALADVSRRGAAAYGVPRVTIARTAVRLRRRGFIVQGALADGLLDPAMPDAVRDAHIGNAPRRAAQDRLNPVSLEPFTEQKLLFHDHMEASGLPVPEVYGTAGPGGVWDRRTGRTGHGPEAFAALLAATPGEVVVKPSFGNRGTDVTVLLRDGDRWTGLRGAPADPADLYRRIQEGDPADVHLVQRRLRNHPTIEEIAGSPVLQTLRLMTIVRPDGSVYIFSGLLKIATGASDTDNYLKGATGNGYSLVTLDDGRLGPFITIAPDGVGTVRTPEVPATGVRVLGRPVPMLAECCELARRAALLLLPMRTLGWDIAITPDGPALIEGNNWWATFEALTPEGWALLTRVP
ncbi:MAG: sugar-transfer associated ATP-grasp domain-containing protein [Thermoleophilia bacterium]